MGFNLVEISAKEGKCWVTGAAWREGKNYGWNEKISDRPQIYYISLIGTPANVTSVWASLIKRKGDITIPEWNYTYPLAGMVLDQPARRMTRIVSREPKYIHCTIVVPTPQLILITSPGVTFPYEDALRQPIVGPRLAAHINTHSRAVCKPEWGEWLYKKTLGSYTNKNAITTLASHGDCLAYLVRPDLNWDTLIEDGIKSGELS